MNIYWEWTATVWQENIELNQKRSILYLIRLYLNLKSYKYVWKQSDNEGLYFEVNTIQWNEIYIFGEMNYDCVYFSLQGSESGI